MPEQVPGCGRCGYERGEILSRRRGAGRRAREPHLLRDGARWESPDELPRFEPRRARRQHDARRRSLARRPSVMTPQDYIARAEALAPLIEAAAPRMERE